MRKLVLKCGLALGDIVMLTAAVRDLHQSYPGAFLTDVRTFYPELWESNPYLTPLRETDSGVETIECSYSLINHANRLPYHCLQGFIEFLNRRLRLAIRLTALRGDVHLSAQERSWFSQVQEVTRRDLPFWIVSAGGKYDVTVKWWESRRYQEVIDHFRGRIQFVQVGSPGHHHPKLEGVIDLRGQTNTRELVRLVYHADGILCPVTGLMHLAAAVPSKRGPRFSRACVVVAGGREPAHWESYPGHQFIHTIGALACCRSAGCWRDRALPLRDGDKRDRPGCRCVNLVGELPRCMDLIQPAEVIRRIDWYYAGRVLRSLNRRERTAAECGIAATRDNDFDLQSLNLHSAGRACDAFVETIPAYPPERFNGRGIVICGGGLRYFPSAWVCIRILRRLGCQLPIQLWHLGPAEVDAQMRGLLAPFGVECVDALEVQKVFPARRLHGWAIKPFALLHSRFRQVLFLDADNLPVRNPEFLFDDERFLARGAIFWPDYNRCGREKSRTIWRSCGLRPPAEPEFETGQMAVDKAKCWRALCLGLWFNEQADFYYRYLHGDKETFHLAFRKLRQPYALVPTPIHSLEHTMCQHDFAGQRLFQHRNRDKWDYLLCNRRIKDFWLESECLQYLEELRQGWDARFSRVPIAAPGHRTNPVHRFPTVCAVMISCRDRDALRRQTLSNLSRTDWADLPVSVHMDDDQGPDRHRRQTRCAYRALQSVVELADYVLFLEDDLDFNRHLRHNLFCWQPFRDRAIALASLYNPGVRALACDRQGRSRIVSPTSIFGSQAFLISKPALRHILTGWHRVAGMQDIRISRLVGGLRIPIRYHAPSLVQHLGRNSVSGRPFHQALDFDPQWKAPAGCAVA